MDSKRLTYIRDRILKLNNTQLSELLAVPDTSISNWIKGKRDIPDYIAKTLDLHVANKLSEVPIPLSLTELFALSDLATRRGQSVKELLLSLIKKAIAPESKATGTNTVPDPDSDPTTGQFHPPLSPEEYRRSLPTGQPDSQQVTPNSPRIGRWMARA